MSQDTDREGTAQTERLSPLLLTSPPPVEGLPREALLAFSAQFAALLKYYNFDNQEEGSFAPFFEADVQVALAQAASFRPGLMLPRLRRQAARLALTREVGTPEPGLKAYAGLLVPVLATVDGWWRKLPANTPVSFRHELEQTIRLKLAPVLAALLAAAPELQPRVASFAPGVWQGGGVGSGWQESPAAALEAVEDGLTRLAARARQALEVLALQPQNQAPQVALFQAFLQLLEYPRQQVNAFPVRQLRFFYEEVLRQRPRPPVPDRALVSFLLTPEAPATFLPAGTALAAGKDALGQDRVYALVADTQVNAATVARVAVLYVRTPGNGEPPGQETFFSTFDPVPPSADGPPSPPQGFPTFGSDSLAPTAVGFALSSPLLELSGGERDITLEFTLTPPPEPLPTQPLFFQVQLSGLTGWIDCGTLQAEWADGQLTLSLSLDASQPAVVPAQSAVLGPEFPDGPPLLRAQLDQTQTSLSGSGLSQAVLAQVAVSVSVRGLRTLSLASSTGPLVAGRPFPPLGYAPALGASFLMGSRELFLKPLRGLSLHLKWASLPVPLDLGPGVQDDGPSWFTTYYNGYQLAVSDSPDVSAADVYTNASFQVQIDYRRGGQWRCFQTGSTLPLVEPPLAGQDIQLPSCVSLVPPPDAEGHPSPVSLFLSKGSAAICPETTWILTAPAGQTLNVPVPSLPTSMNLGTLPDSGVLRVRLASPTYGFGQSLYPQAAVALALAHAQQLMPKEDKPEEDEPRTLPMALNLPFTPMLEEVSLDYQAHQVLDPLQPETGAFFHLGPLGTQRAEEAGVTLLPALPSGGTLLLGLRGVQPLSPVSCLFVLQDSAVTAVSEPNPDTLSWSSLTAEGWVRLAPAEAPTSGQISEEPVRGVVSDATNGLRQSGLVQFLLPEDTSPWSGQPPGLVWVRGQTDAPENHPATQALLTQAAWCERVLNPLGDPAYDVPLPPGSLTALGEANPSIAGVLQPLPSQGGRRGEDIAALYTRVSERCRHKARAVTPWDYERLVLEAFPWVFSARCLPQVSVSEGRFQRTRARSVLMLVSPRVYTPATLTASAYPPFIEASRLEEIRSFLAARAPASADVQVANPQYETVMIHCTVKAAAKQDPLSVSQRLNAELRAFLSPWIFRPDEARGMAWPTSSQEVLRFIQTRPSVSSVLSFSCSVGQGQPRKWPGIPESPWLLRVSAWQHDLKALSFG
ncbi:baseplate J/gp47 family protein [Stigmatella sp. ncwal1]|uniref:Baseplate J/gp47 family protein n=1 Tax=Stigmatella ashevillensis TaxID=2995309 RepID=A0ABT5DJS0_9BACT|nr:baseplate J/gp47 family protein [Stigmatella ashevillena]MDC0713304.1 baseplate J/gp47 family protein [Stigmatella ashevillena]